MNVQDDDGRNTVHINQSMHTDKRHARTRQSRGYISCAIGAGQKSSPEQEHNGQADLSRGIDLEAGGCEKRAHEEEQEEEQGYNKRL